MNTDETTLRAPVCCAGIGVHSGKAASVEIHPAAAGAGIVFRRVDLAGEPLVPARYDAVGDLRLSTTITNAEGAHVGTVEHLMAALAGLGVDNARIDIDGPEVPVMDGSAEPFRAAIEGVGLRSLSAPREVIRILKPVSVSEEDKSASFSPAEVFEMDVAIDFADSVIGQQRFCAAIEPACFSEALAPARTFGFMRDLEGLRAANLAQGASLENTIAIDEGRIVNEEGLRFPDEFVRHKALDALGDLALAGRSFRGRFTSRKSGHALNNRLLQALFAAPAAWRVERADAPS